MFSNSELETCIQIRGARLTLALYVQPNAKRTSFEKIHDNQLKLKVNAPPEDGRANLEIIKFLSRYFSVKKNQISILSGELNRHKKIEIIFAQEMSMSQISDIFNRNQT